MELKRRKLAEEQRKREEEERRAEMLRREKVQKELERINALEVKDDDNEEDNLDLLDDGTFA